MIVGNCDNCGSELASDHSGARKEGLWALTLVDCQHCDMRYLVRLYRGKEPRKMQEKTEEIQVAILETFEKEGAPLTVRRLFYVLANRYQLVTKNLSGYRTVQNQSKIMRRAGSIPYSWIADNSRWTIKPETYSGMEGALQQMHDYYRRNLWSSQRVYVEIWIEKDSMAGVISPVTRKFGVPLYVARGFSSLTLIHQAAEEIKRIGKPTYIYQFGDFDKYGFDIATSVPDELRKEHGVDVHFERVAITEEQVSKYNLPVRPAGLGKKVKVSKKWPYDYAVDLDAMEAPVLRDIAERVITQHIDEHQWEMELDIQRAEQQSLLTVIDGFGKKLY